MWKKPEVVQAERIWAAIALLSSREEEKEDEMLISGIVKGCLGFLAEVPLARRELRYAWAAFRASMCVAGCETAAVAIATTCNPDMGLVDVRW